MYRKAAPRPWDASPLGRWAKALRAKRRALAVSRYAWPWPVGFGGVALAALLFAAVMPRSLELSCVRSPEGRAGCSLVRHHLGGRTSRLDVESVAAHASPMLSDDAPKGPYLLLQSREGPHWVPHARASEVEKQVSAVLYGDGAAPAVSVPLPAGPESDGGLAAAALFLTMVLMTLVHRTRLVADIGEGTVTVHQRSFAGTRRRSLGVFELGEVTVGPEGGDSEFSRVTFGPETERVAIVAGDAACERVKAFLESCRDEVRRAKRAERKAKKGDVAKRRELAGDEG